MARRIRRRAEDLAPGARAAVVAVPVLRGLALWDVGLAVQEERHANEGLVHRQDAASR